MSSLASKVVEVTLRGLAAEGESQSVFVIEGISIGNGGDGDALRRLGDATGRGVMAPIGCCRSRDSLSLLWLPIQVTGFALQ